MRDTALLGWVIHQITQPLQLMHDQQQAKRNSGPMLER